MDVDTQRQLLTGEHVVWEGRPATGLILRPIGIFLIPFSLFWFGGAIVWNVVIWNSDLPDGVPALCVRFTN